MARPRSHIPQPPAAIRVAETLNASVPETTIEGTVKRVTYYREDTGFVVASVAPSTGGNLFVLVGRLSRLSPGETVRVSGNWESHPVHGRRFVASDCRAVLPATVSGIRAYLGSGLIPGVGPALAERIVERFGIQTLEVIDQSPERLTEVSGLGGRRRCAITRAWIEHRSIRGVMVQLADLGISAGLAARIYQTYADRAAQVVQEHPYDLARKVDGIGFRTADAIATRLGHPPDAGDRLQAGLVHVLWQAAGDGHVFLPEAELLRRGRQVLGARPGLLRQALATLRQDRGDIVIDDLPDARAVYLPPFFGAESAVARRLRTMIDEPADRLAAFRTVDWDRAFGYLESRGGRRLSAVQQIALQRALTSKLAVITGGPGTGKTTAIRGLVTLLEAKQRTYLLAAPTGKAARRLGDATGRSAVTLHRLLGLRPGGETTYHADRPLPADLIVVDEASMLDLQLANALIRALPRGGHLLLVGDVDQLPPVGPGEVLRSIVTSEIAQVSRLEAIFRQTERGGIVLNAHRINRGEPPDFVGHRDAYFIEEDDPEELARLVVDIAVRRLPERYRLDPFRDIQVLAPMHRGTLGAAALNERLQAAFNPGTETTSEWPLAGRTLRVGDRVLAIRNNYRLDVFNGDAGTIVDVKSPARAAVVALDDGRCVEFDATEVEQLLHAYALSVHRAQGSEFPAVVLPLHPLYGPMLRRDLLYTAVTRARQLLVVLGSRSAARHAVATGGRSERYNALAHRLSLHLP